MYRGQNPGIGKVMRFWQEKAIGIDISDTPISGPTQLGGIHKERHFMVNQKVGRSTGEGGCKLLDNPRQTGEGGSENLNFRRTSFMNAPLLIRNCVRNHFLSNDLIKYITTRKYLRVEIKKDNEGPENGHDKQGILLHFADLKV